MIGGCAACMPADILYISRITLPTVLLHFSSLLTVGGGYSLPLIL